MASNLRDLRKFPAEFVWGAATSSYQIEGAWREGGKGLSIWDAFSHTPGKIRTGETGDIACDHYHRLHEDVAMMASMGLPAYRFSLSWSRIQPTGSGSPNAEGLRYYAELIDALLAHGITPWVTLYHWDLPLALQVEHDGWLDPTIADRFAEYADICFDHFGDRVKHWVTLNEPWVVAMMGHGLGVHAPGRSSTSEPYIVGHNLLRAHGRAVDRYRDKYQPTQNGVIGLTNNCDWREPLTDSVADRAAATTALDFFLGWFADPIYRGEYPEVMRRNLGDRLPKFTAGERYLIEGSSDFFGLNHYTTLYASRPGPDDALDSDVFGNGGIAEDQDVKLTADDAWERTAMGWAIVPWGCRKLLGWIQERYDPEAIYILENGAAFEEEDGPPAADGAIEDPRRVAYLEDYLGACHQAIEDGVNLKGYFCWSLMDNFEWSFGTSMRFGLHRVEPGSLQRIPRRSAGWYSGVIAANGLPIPAGSSLQQQLDR